MDLSLRQMHAFREIMRTGSVSAAARALGRTQPAVSAMVAKLEEELRFKLFDRIGGRLMPRPEAHYFLEEAEDILDRLERAQRTMQEVATEKRGTLRLAVFPAAADVFLPQLVTRFLRDKPEVSVSLMMQSSTTIWEWVASQQYDIGLAEVSPPRHTLIQSTFDLRTVCALARDHPLASQERITPAHLSGEPAAALYGDHPIAVHTRDRFKEVGAVFNPRFELQTFMPALELVRKKLCFCICDPITAQSYQYRRPEAQDIVFRPFSPDIPCPAAILTPAHRPVSLLAGEFAQWLTDELRSLMPRLESHPPRRGRP